MAERNNKREELTAELDKLDGWQATALAKVDAKREQILEEYVKFLVHDYARGLRSIDRNNGPVDYEFLLSGFAKEIRNLYSRKK